MKYERGSFITVGSRDTLRGLPPTAQCLYMWLSSYANETGNCFPSRKTLAEDVGCVERTVDAMLDLLLENGLIEVKGRKEGDKQLSNLYKVLIVPPLAGDATPPSIKCPTPLQEMPTNSNYLTQPIEVSIGEDAEGPDGSGEVINAFMSINPSSKTLFWKSQADAARRMIATHGLERVLQVIVLLKQTNKEPFFTPITTPTELERGWAKLGAKLAQKQAEVTRPKTRGRGFA